MEQVLVVARNDLNHLFNKDYFFYNNGLDNFLNIINDKHLFINRDSAEVNEFYKQIIPYAFITNDNYCYILKRLSKQKEKRLHNKLSLGVGGHINPIHHPVDSIIEEGLLRELNEELIVTNEQIQKIKLVGIINDDNTEVGKLHLGIVYHIQVNNKDIEINEIDKMEGQWVHKSELGKYYNNMESWSQIILNELINL
ncbi:Predicted phosphoesterase (MutT family) [Mycobacteroides abscessus subsp. abscessus]|nr:Predicted phosphoesterase (MutT family) [Mycobacteroides abscessus subsp. abscessus]